MSKTVTIIDYGIGNIHSVTRAFEKVGATPLLTTDREQILNAERLVLPGVGAFADCMSAFNSFHLGDVVREFARKERPLLGICVGMQMLFDVSEEFGTTEGLGILKGRVVALPKNAQNGERLRVPNIGWIELSAAKSWDGTVLDSVEPKTSVYFVHSYYAMPASPADILATYDFGGHSIVAAVSSGPLVGCQFHPEKSGPAGLSMLKRFMSL